MAPTLTQVLASGSDGGGIVQTNPPYMRVDLAAGIAFITARTTPPFNTWTDITGASVALTLVGAHRCRISAGVYIEPNALGSTGGELRIVIDGTPIHAEGEYEEVMLNPGNTVAQSPEGVIPGYISDPLSVGAHTIKLQCRSSSPSGFDTHFAIAPGTVGYLSIQELPF